MKKWQDLFYVFSKSMVVEELYYNPDAACGGQIVLNVFTFEDILKARSETSDPATFFEILEGICHQELIDIESDKGIPLDIIETLFREPTYRGLTSSTMRRMVATAQYWAERANKKRSVANEQ